MAQLSKCFKLHLDLSTLSNLDEFVNNLVKIGDVTFDEKNEIFIWIDDNKEKKDLIRCLRKVGIKEYFCERIEYENIGKDRDFNFISAWFMDKYRAYVYREAEKQNQSQLRTMCENIEKARHELEIKNRDGDSLDDKNQTVKEAPCG